MVLYLETYAARVSDRYTTRRGKTIAIAHFWRFLAEKHPEVTSPAQVRPVHLREYIPHIMAHALTVRRGNVTGDEVRCTAHSWLTDVRTFFSDLCTWALEPDSPFLHFAPPTVPQTRHSLLGLGFDKTRVKAGGKLGHHSGIRQDQRKCRKKRLLREGDGVRSGGLRRLKGGAFRPERRTLSLGKVSLG